MFFGPRIMSSCMPPNTSAAAEAAKSSTETGVNEGTPIPVVFGSAFVSSPTVFWVGHEEKVAPGDAATSLPRVTCAVPLGACFPNPGPLTGTI